MTESPEDVTSSLSRTMAPRAGRGILSVMTLFVLALALAFSGAVISGLHEHVEAEHHERSPTTANAIGTDHLVESPCHHEVSSDGPDVDSASHSGHHAGHDPSGGCCAMAVCGGACASVCSGAGVNAALSSAIVPSPYRESGLVLRALENALSSDSHEAVCTDVQRDPARDALERRVRARRQEGGGTR